MRTTERIPGFAICARCGARRELGGCPCCGLLVCRGCRGARECAVCHGERMAAAERTRRRARLREHGRRAAVVALIAASGVSGLGAAFLPEGPVCGEPLPPVSVGAAAAMGGGEAAALTAPLPLTSQRAPWTEPLAFRCFAAAGGSTCCVLSPR